MRQVLYVTCDPTESSFVSIFNTLEEYLLTGKGIENLKNEDICYKFLNIPQYSNSYDLINNIKNTEYKENINVPSPTNVSVVVDVIIPEDDSQIDVFSYRYLFVLKNQLLRQGDIVVFTCNRIYYNKIANFVLFENIFSNALFAYDITDKKVKKFPSQFSISTEWLPAMSFINNEKHGFYDTLSAPLFNSTKEFDSIFQEYKNERINLSNLFQQSKNKNIGQVVIKTHFIASVLYWLKESSETVVDFIGRHSSSVSALTILLLAIQLKYISKRKTDKFDDNYLNKVLNICCDFSEGILQMVENIVCHSNGGCFLLRLNDNLDKINDQYTYNKEILKFESYIRIALVDYSKKGIAESIKEKHNFTNNISLNEVFDFEKIENKEYEKHLLNDDSTVHHYGLPIFKHIVLQYSGCFTVKSKGDYRLSPSDFSINFEEKGLIPKQVPTVCNQHISGTEYDIILPLSQSLYVSREANGITSISFNSNIQTDNEKMHEVFEEDIYNFFSVNINNVANELKEKYANIQELKEETINQSAKVLSNLLEKHIKDNTVFYFYIDNKKTPYRRTEIIAKIILKTFSILNLKHKRINFLLYGLSEQKLHSFVRQFALFYRKGSCKYMKNNQLYIVSDNYKSEVLLYGEQLNTCYKYLCSQRFNYGISANVVELLKHITQRFSTDIPVNNKNEMIPINFNILRRMETSSGELILSKKKWFFYKLYTVINNDIHDKYLGCKIPNTHVRVNNIHIDTFYECQLLFGNSFWCEIFSHCIVEYILNNESINKNNPIILYGYETYSEHLLLLTKQRLSKELNVPVEYLIFENSKYITSNEKSKKRIRYFERVVDTLKEDFKKTSFIFVNGISTTLSTFKEQLYKQLCIELKKHDFEPIKTNYAFVMIQVIDESKEKNLFNDYISINDEFVSSKKDYLDFVVEKHCGYLMSVGTKWYTPYNCELCSPTNPEDEIILVETNDTSTVPMTLIKPNRTNLFNGEIRGCCHLGNSFLNDINNEKYLYYCHLNRNGNHHQYYIRTANFVQENLYENSELLKWLEQIRKIEINKNLSNTINIIVCPSHFSNETFVSSVNQYVFDNQAHVISLNIKKEFRDSFEAKFSNYGIMLQLIKDEMPDIEFEVNFYYVDDQVITGATFQRAKSLITGLFAEYLTDTNSNQFHINIFKAMIILVNRNSTKSISNFFDSSQAFKNSNDKIDVPFYSFINLKTPSIRSYGDSCPICQKVQQLETLVNESSLYSTEKYWRKKLVDNQIKNLQQAKKEKYNDNYRNDQYKNRGFRRLQCSEIIWRNLEHNYDTIPLTKIKIEDCIYEYLNKLNSNEERIEYLISFVKVLSRPHIIYQENINSSILQIILELYLLYFSNSKEKHTQLQKMILDIVNDERFNYSKYHLFRALVACLCSLGSNLFYRDKGDMLIHCLEKGRALEKLYANSTDTSFDDFFRFQLKLNMFSNKDSMVKVKKMSDILFEKIKKENIL